MVIVIKMMKMLTLLMMFCVFCVNALPPGSRVRRGFNNSGSGYGSERGDGYYNQGSSDRDASVSHESGEGCDSEENNDSREHTYNGRDDYGQRQDDRYHSGTRPR